jgi:hypothetical protein
VFLVSERMAGSFSIVAIAFLTLAGLLVSSCLVTLMVRMPQSLLLWFMLATVTGAWLAFIFYSRGRGSVIATAHGFEVWRHGVPVKHISWRMVHDMRQARLEQGMRLAVWTTAKWRIWYSPLFGVWRSLPPGRPELDLMIDGAFDMTRRVWDELLHRWRAANPQGRMSENIQELDLALGRPAES